MDEEILNLDDDQKTSVDEMVLQISLANLTILRNKSNRQMNYTSNLKKLVFPQLLN